MNVVDSSGWLAYLAVSIILAILWTQDEHFKGLAGVEYVEKKNPDSQVR